MSEELTRQQKRVLTWLGKYQQQNLNTPSYQEIADAFKLSRNTIKYHIHALQRKGYIRRPPNSQRCIVILKQIT